jgi:DNA-directed RNA polymerase beta subunit
MVDNRIIVDYNNKTNLLETIVNSYHIETKSRASIHMRGFKYYVKTSSFKDIPLFIFFKALGIESEQVISYKIYYI